MTLHEDKSVFEEAVRITAQQMKILDIYVEKDYWVTFALKTIFNHDIGEESVFKGGTALSKCFGLIERFSEDIDLVITKKHGETPSKSREKIRTISKVVGEFLPEVEVEGITHKMGMNRKTAHSYDMIFDNKFGQVRDKIIVEATWLGYSEPSTTREISSFIYDMLKGNGQEEEIKKYNLAPFNVRVLESTRTFCEKIMSLVRFSYTSDPIISLKNKVRHCYDLHKLINHTEINDFFKSEEFEKMMLKVANDDVESYKNNNDWLLNHPKDALIFKDLNGTWVELEKTYNSNQEFAALVYGELPNHEDVKTTLSRIKERLDSITWNINLS